jgi:hypothetical protein
MIQRDRFDPDAHLRTTWLGERDRFELKHFGRSVLDDARAANGWSDHGRDYRELRERPGTRLDSLAGGPIFPTGKLPFARRVIVPAGVFKSLRCRALLGAVLTLLLLTPASVWAAKKDREATPAAANPSAPGNLAIIDVRAYDVATPGADRRLLVRALIENQTPENFEAAWVLDLGRTKPQQNLATCQGQGLPQGRVAVCEMWVPGEAVKEQETLEVQLSRSGSLGTWDRDAKDDTRQVVLRTTPERGNILRIAEWKLFPTILSGPTDVQFSFTVEGAHLVWVMTPDSTPRLLAGHPADGVLVGKGKERVKQTGPVTVIARNSLGAFVYQTIPVVNPYTEVKPKWTEAPPQNANGTQPANAGAALAQVLDAGVYDVDEDTVVLDYLARYLQAKDWAAEIKRLRQQVEGEPQPAPASALNPRTKRPR